MSRPTLEVADIVRAAGNSFWDKHGTRLAWPHRKVLDAIVRCRTAALGGHRDQCTSCGHQAISFNSCRNRHCPKCQGNARAKWLAARSAELLPVPYFHILFTLPHELSALILQNKRLLYDLLFRTSAASLLELARDPASSCPSKHSVKSSAASSELDSVNSSNRTGFSSTTPSSISPRPSCNSFKISGLDGVHIAAYRAYFACNSRLPPNFPYKAHLALQRFLRHSSI